MTDALAYFSAKLAHGTDPSDVYAAQKSGDFFTLIEVRNQAAWDQGHAVGAIHMPYREIEDRAPVELDSTAPIVVYCWSPGCNGGARGAIEFARLGFQVREMIGGYEYWLREGLPVTGGDGLLPRVFDPQVMVIRPGEPV